MLDLKRAIGVTNVSSYKRDQPTPEELLQKIVEKTLVFIFNQNLAREFEKLGLSRKMVHVCEGTGRRGNWFSRTLNAVEDMRVSSLLKLGASAQRHATRWHDWWSNLLTDDILQWAELAIDIPTEGMEVVRRDPNVFIRLEPYVRTFRNRKAITDEEAHTFELLAAEHRAR